MKRYISAILIPCLLLQFTGCSSSNYITKEQLVNNGKCNAELIGYDNVIYRLEKEHYTIKNDTVFIDNSPTYYNPNKRSRIALNDIKEINAKERNSTNTILLVTIGATVIMGLILLAVLGEGYTMKNDSWNN